MSKLHRGVAALARRYRDRAAELQLKGKKRDNDMIAYFVGAAVSAEEMAQICVEEGDPESAETFKVLAGKLGGFLFGLQFRGFSELEKALKENPEEEAKG